MKAPYLCKVFDTRDEWMRARLDSIGGSEVAAVLGYGRFGALAVQLRHLGRLAPEKPKLNRRAEAALEPIAAEDAAEKLGLAVVEPAPGKIALYRSTRIPHAHATPDRFVCREIPERVHAGTLPRRALAILALENGPEGELFEYPIETAIRLQWEMLVTGVETAYFHVLFGAGADSMVSKPIQANAEIQDSLREKIPAWWRRHIENREPVQPSPTTEGGPEE